MYAEMPPTEKQAWTARAEADKERYLQELTTYEPPPGYDEKGDAIIQAPIQYAMIGLDPNNMVGGAAEMASMMAANGGLLPQPPHHLFAAAAATTAATTTTTRRRKSGKAERDANAPKRNMSAYLLYQNAMREKFKRDVSKTTVW
jgi:hypothetical protein